MKLKAALKYQIHGMIRPVIIFYIVIYAILILAGIQQAVLTYEGVTVESNGIEMASAVFMFIVGLNSFKSTFHLFLANGVSRITMFESFLGAILPTAAVMALIDNINNLILSSVGNFNSMFYHSYHVHYGSISSFGAKMQVFLDGFIWMTILYIAVAMIGFLITTLYYRMGRSLKLIVSVGVPVFFLIVLPYIDSYVLNGAIFETLGKIFYKAMGFADGYNPYISVLSSFLTFAVFSGLSFLAIRRATVKK